MNFSRLLSLKVSLQIIIILTEGALLIFLQPGVKKLLACLRIETTTLVEMGPDPTRPEHTFDLQ